MTKIIFSTFLIFLSFNAAAILTEEIMAPAHAVESQNRDKKQAQPNVTVKSDMPTNVQTHSNEILHNDNISSSEGRTWTSIEIILSTGVLIFAITVLLLVTVIILKAQKPWSPQSILRFFGVTLIMSLAVLLITAGYSKDQIAPVMGLLGVIAGYLLGDNNKTTT